MLHPSALWTGADVTRRQRLNVGLERHPGLHAEDEGVGDFAGAAMSQRGTAALSLTYASTQGAVNATCLRVVC